MPKEKGEGLVEYALTLVLVAVVVIAALIVIDNILEGGFDRAYDEGLIYIDSNVIPINSESLGHPRATLPVANIPGSNSDDHPRYWNLSGCILVTVPAGATSLHAAAPVSSEIAEKIVIQMPIPGARYINICGPEGKISTQVYLWFEYK